MTHIGVDGCRTGWFSIALDGHGSWENAVYGSFEELWRAHQEASHILIDVPIGLRTNGPNERACDTEARRTLGFPRGASVFPAPCRAALTAADHQEASRINRERTGRGLSIQSWAIMPKIHEVDHCLRSTSAARSVVREVHPEVLFWALNGGNPVLSKKKSGAGFEDRMEILRRANPKSEAIVEDALSRWMRKEVARDDILDALAGAITAELGGDELETLPKEPERDEKQLPMEMVFARRRAVDGM